MDDDEPKYKLIHAVDPTKVKVPIKERFAKLTLSSNKKKPAEPVANLESEVKQRSASRNLLELLNTQQDIQSPSFNHVNPLLRSDSSSRGEEQSDQTQLESSFIQAASMKSISSSNMDCTEYMEPLQVSEQLQHNDNDNGQAIIAQLSQQVASLKISSEKSSDAEIKYVAGESSICISSSETESDEESVITISDTSSNNSNDNSNATNACFDYDLITSNIPNSNESICLPYSLSNDKVDRMEAFLRDVSQECRETLQQVKTTIATADTDDSPLGTQSVLDEIERMSIREITLKEDKIFTDEEKKNRYHLLVNADTESMTSLSDNFNERSENAAKQHNVMLEDTISLSQSHASMFALNSQPTLRKSHESIASSENNIISEKLELDDTVPNTQNWINDFSTPSKQKIKTTQSDDDNDKSFTHDDLNTSKLPIDSLVISETSSEASSINNEIVPSEEQHVSTVYDSNSSSNDDGNISQIKVSMASINISAKINIKIHIPTESSTDDEYELPLTATDEADEAVSKDENRSTDKSATSLPETEANTDIDTYCETEKQQQQTAQTPSSSEQEVDDKHFMLHAEKLLNELYGKSWKTPDVVRALKRTSGSNSKKSCGKKIEKQCNTADNAKIITTKGCTKTPVKKNISNGSKSFMKENTKVTSESNSTSKQSKTPTKTAASKTSSKPLESFTNQVEESILDDFSIFRSDIVKSNLNSTHLTTPMKLQQQSAPPTAISTEPRRLKKITQNTEKSNVFKVPQTEVKTRVVATKSGRQVKQRFQPLVDNNSDDSQGDNASDDEDMDRTEKDTPKGNSRRRGLDRDADSDDSWKSNQSSSEDSDYKETPIRKQTTRNTKSRKTQRKQNSKDALVYLDLSKDEVTFLEDAPSTPAANNDEKFDERLRQLLNTCKFEDKPKLPATPQANNKTKRKLFNPNFGDEPEILETHNTAKTNLNNNVNDILLNENEQTPDPSNLKIINKHLEAIKTGEPIFKITPPRSKPSSSNKKTTRVTPAINDEFATPKSLKKTNKTIQTGRLLDKLCDTPTYKYNFLKSLDVCVAKTFCHPDALNYRENYRLKKEELTTILYDLYNEKLFDNELNVPLNWNKKLLNTAGRCLNKKKFGKRTSVIELSEKVLTSADRLRCTLIHELCHAATWIFSGEGGHGSTWKSWARKANSTFTELPKIGVCHQYEIEYKYTYKCTLCGAKSHAHSKSKKVENIRCSYCYGAIEIFLNKKDKDGNILPTPVREPTGFAKFVKDNYNQHKSVDRKHADVMKILSNEFTALKVASNAN